MNLGKLARHCDAEVPRIQDDVPPHCRDSGTDLHLPPEHQWLHAAVRRELQPDHAYNGSTFVYNAQYQLVGGSIQATYDGLGRCVRRTVGGVTKLFTYDDWNPITEWDGAGNWRAWTIYGPKADEVLLRYDAVYGPLVYKQDNQGSITFVLDGPTHIAEQYSYDVYGRPTIMDGAGNERVPGTAIGNRYMYTGREWIAEIQHYDYRHRFYNPDTGRFLQTDPKGFDGGDMNLFRYCSDDPVDRTDPTGLDAEENANADSSHHYSYYLQPQLKPSALDGWAIARMTGRANATPYQCAAAAAILAGSWRSDGLHRAPEATSWLRGPDLAKSSPRFGALVAKGWDKNDHYQNTSNQSSNYRGNHAGIFLGFTNKQHTKMKIMDQWVVSKDQRTGVTTVMPIGTHEVPVAGYSRVDSSKPYSDQPVQVVLRPPDPSEQLPRSK